MKSVSDTIKRLQQRPSKRSKEQIKIIVSSITNHRWGTPKLEAYVSWRIKATAKNESGSLTGKEDSLVPPAKSKRKTFPKEVEAIALKHWTDTTIPEPSVQKRLTKKSSRNDEIIPTRWQHLSQKEQYANFQSECSIEISDIMEKDEEKIRRVSISAR